MYFNSHTYFLIVQSLQSALWTLCGKWETLYKEMSCYIWWEPRSGEKSVPGNKLQNVEGSLKRNKHLLKRRVFLIGSHVWIHGSSWKNCFDKQVRPWWKKLCHWGQKIDVLKPHAIPSVLSALYLQFMMWAHHGMLQPPCLLLPQMNCYSLEAKEQINPFFHTLFCLVFNWAIET